MNQRIAPPLPRVVGAFRSDSGTQFYRVVEWNTGRYGMETGTSRDLLGETIWHRAEVDQPTLDALLRAYGAERSARLDEWGLGVDAEVVTGHGDCAVALDGDVQT